MKFKVGFISNIHKNKAEPSDLPPNVEPVISRKSVVQVEFPNFQYKPTYYNDQFDLKVGDRVYVEGKLEGQCGRVVDVSYTFKIKLSDYKRVIAVVDTTVKGQMYFADSYFLAFDPSVIPACKIKTWFKTAVKEEYIYGQDEGRFRLADLHGLKVDHDVKARGVEYYLDGAVAYISLDHSQGYAIVVGRKPYEVEFTYRDGEIGNLNCDCFCSYHCKHEVAAMLQLRELLEKVEKHYAAQYERAEYFAAISKKTLFEFVVGEQACGSLTLN